MGFKPKESDFYDISSPMELSFNREQFVEDVFNEEYIVVVGSEVIMSKEEEPTGDVNQYLLRHINNSLGQHYKDYNELALHSGQGFDPIRNLINHKDFTFAVNDMSPELKGLLASRLFPIVLTTTFDGYLETLMKQIWGNRLRVVNIDEMNSLRDLRYAISDYRSGRQYNEPTLFYIFGKATSDESKKFVHTDDDAIQIVEKWMQLPKEDPIMNLIRSRKILALGCKFDNWYFRFFWYILKREISKFREGQVAFMLDDNNLLDHQLNTFLKQSRIFRHDDARAFMSEVIEWLSSTADGNPFKDLILKKRREGGIFLSYCSKDVIMTSQLFFALRKQGYNVWFDNRSLYGGDYYNQEIDRAIGKAQVFLPILSPSVAEDFKEGHYKDRYYVKEWRKACQLENKRIIPLAIDGYDLRDPYQISVFEGIVNNALSGIDLMQHDGFSSLTKSLDKELSKEGGCYE